MNNELFNYGTDVQYEAEKLKNKMAKKNNCGCSGKHKKIFRAPYKTIHLSLASAEPENLLTAIELKDPIYQLQALKMAATFNTAITPEGRFDLKHAIAVVNTMHPQAAIVETLDTHVTQTNNSVSAMVSHILQLIESILGLTLGTTTKDKLRASVDETFTNLAVQEDGAWIFWHEETAHKTTYVYNLLFAVQSEHTGQLMLAVPMSFEITAHISKRQVLFITLEDSVSYDVRLQSLSVIQALEKNIGNLPLSSLSELL